MEKLTKLEEIVRTGDVSSLESDFSLLTMNDVPFVDSVIGKLINFLFNYGFKLVVNCFQRVGASSLQSNAPAAAPAFEDPFSFRKNKIKFILVIYLILFKFFRRSFRARRPFRQFGPVCGVGQRPVRKFRRIWNGISRVQVEFRRFFPSLDSFQDVFANSQPSFNAADASWGAKPMSPPKALAGGKRPPPRPAPPKTRPITPKDPMMTSSDRDPFAGGATAADPFGGGAGAVSGGGFEAGFANFADFSKFS